MQDHPGSTPPGPLKKAKRIQDSTGQQAETPKKRHGFWVDEKVKIVLGFMLKISQNPLPTRVLYFLSQL